MAKNVQHPKKSKYGQINRKSDSRSPNANARAEHHQTWEYSSTTPPLINFQVSWSISIVVQNGRSQHFCGIVGHTNLRMRGAQNPKLWLCTRFIACSPNSAHTCTFLCDWNTKWNASHSVSLSGIPVLCTTKILILKYHWGGTHFSIKYVTWHSERSS